MDGARDAGGEQCLGAVGAASAGAGGFCRADWQMEMCDEGIQAGTRDCLLFTGSETRVKDSVTGRTALIPIMPDLQRGRAALANQQR